MNKIKDFDAMFEELRQEKIEFQIRGQVFGVSKLVPASTMLDIERCSAQLIVTRNELVALNKIAINARGQNKDLTGIQKKIDERVKLVDELTIKVQDAMVKLLGDDNIQALDKLQLSQLEYDSIIQYVYLRLKGLTDEEVDAFKKGGSGSNKPADDIKKKLI